MVLPLNFLTRLRNLFNAAFDDASEILFAPFMKRMVVHPMSSASWRIFSEKFRRHSPFHAASRLQRFAAVGSLLVRLPFYALEKLIFKRRLADHHIEKGPIFIVGHWRSGTTHLHNLLSQDPQFSYLSFSNMVMPHDLLLGRILPVIPWIMKFCIPKTRGIDSLTLNPQSPQEEELALFMLGGVSYYNCYFFPQQWDEYFAESISNPNDFSEDLKAEKGVVFAYHRLISKLSYFYKGKRLLLKNPASTSRIAMLKSLFPNAKFVHVRRNPYAVFASSKARLPRMIDGFSWNDPLDINYEDIAVDSYRLLMEQYFKQRDSIPEEDLFETSYEELTEDPDKVIAEIYSKFGLERSEESLQRHADYLKSQKSYQKNSHRMTRAQVERIQNEWGFAFREWNYEMPDRLEIVD